MRSRFLALPVLLWATCTMAQPPASGADGGRPFVFGVVHGINSAILGQERHVNVYLPDGYADSTLSYPVIYVLDGSAHEDFPHIAGLAQYMNMYELLPKSIVVGIANEGPSRYHDFTHVTRSDSDKVWVPSGGGSAPFIEFMEKELQPFIVAHYRTNGCRSIIGQSLGGLLAMEILFKKPELFDDYIAVSPSLWWDDGSLAGTAEQWTKANRNTPKRVFIAMAKDDTITEPALANVLTAFRTNTRPPFMWIHVPFPEETHATILHRAVYRGFEWLTSGK